MVRFLCYEFALLSHCLDKRMEECKKEENPACHLLFALYPTDTPEIPKCNMECEKLSWKLDLLRWKFCYARNSDCGDCRDWLSVTPIGATVRPEEQYAYLDIVQGLLDDDFEYMDDPEYHRKKAREQLEYLCEIDDRDDEAFEDLLSEYRRNEQKSLFEARLKQKSMKELKELCKKYSESEKDEFEIKFGDPPELSGYTKIKKKSDLIELLLDYCDYYDYIFEDIE